MFPHPDPDVMCGKTLEPPLLRAYPEIKEQITGYCVKKRATLTIENVHEIVHDKIIPTLFDQWKKEDASRHLNPDGSRLSIEDPKPLDI
jgi:hypothetical protein